MDSFDVWSLTDFGFETPLSADYLGNGVDPLAITRLRELLARDGYYDVARLSDTEVARQTAERLRRGVWSLERDAFGWRRVVAKTRWEAQREAAAPTTVTAGATVVPAPATAAEPEPAPAKQAVQKKFGVLKLVLRATGKSSVSKTAPGSPPPKNAEAGADDFCFSPGPQLDDKTWSIDPSKTDAVKVVYEITDPDAAISSAKLQLFRRGHDAAIWTRDLKAAEYTDGEHTLKFGATDDWTGTVDTNADFPDGCVTAEHSPYTLKLAVAGSGECVSKEATTQFRVIVADVTLELGPGTVLPADKPAAAIRYGSHRTVHGGLGGKLPEAGKTVEIKLLGNLFKTGGGEMYDNTAFDMHNTQWNGGCLIPVMAKLRVRSSSGAPVHAPLALGNVKCLWDWEDVGEDTSRLDAVVKQFVTRALNYDKDTTKPKGDNCHKKRGGKRTDDGATEPVFPAQAGYAAANKLVDAKFPFKVVGTAKRKWSSWSEPWRSGKLASMTGALFQPSRMAGDGYRVTCYVTMQKDGAGPAELDIEGDLTKKNVPSASTGTFQIWRKHALSRYVKKKAFASTIPVDAVRAYYDKAWVELEIAYASIDTMQAAGYNAAIAGCVTGMDAFAQAAIDPAVNQHVTGDYCVTFRSYNDYRATLQAALGFNNAQFATWLAGPGAPLNSAAKYESFCDSWGMRILEAVCDPELSASDGVTLCQFVGVHNIGGGGGLNGYAADLPSATRQRVAFITCATPGAYSGNANTLQQTTAHEIGHHLFMPHAPDGVGADGGPAPDMHDKDDHNCTMSYNFSAERRWCGLCVLRLRGWDKTALDKDGTKNSHP